jgi:hypothetical protein
MKIVQMEPKEPENSKQQRLNFCRILRHKHERIKFVIGILSKI